jgi:O-antigen ligase
LPGWLRRLAGLAAAASVPAMVYSYARAALVTLVIGSVIWLLLLRPKRGLQLAAICALAAIALAPTTLQERLNPNNTASDVPLRTDIGASALRIYDQHEFLGVGLNNFQLAYADLSIQEAGAQKRLLHDTQLLVPTAAPSQYLNTLVEQGLLGVVALGLFLLLALATGFRAARSKIPAVSSLGLGLGAGVFSLIIYSFLEISLQESQLIPLFVLLAAASVAESSYRPEVPARGRRGLDLPRPAPRAALGRPVAQR